MEKSLLIVVLLGVALISYGPLTSYFSAQEESNCACPSIQAMVADSEGSRTCMYRDSLNIRTIGIGFNLERGDARATATRCGVNFDNAFNGGCITQAQITCLFNNDLQRAQAGARGCVGSFNTLPGCIQNVLVDMTFNMGRNSLCTWPNFVAQLGRRDFRGAADNMQGSRWCGQVGRRCTRNVGIVRSC